MKKICDHIFYDILIYHKSLQDHLEHLPLIFPIIRKEQMFLNKGKCEFSISRVEYLGHFIAVDGVLTDPSKI